MLCLSASTSLMWVSWHGVVLTPHNDVLYLELTQGPHCEIPAFSWDVQIRPWSSPVRLWYKFHREFRLQGGKYSNPNNAIKPALHFSSHFINVLKGRGGIYKLWAALFTRGYVLILFYSCMNTIMGCVWIIHVFQPCALYLSVTVWNVLSAKAF